MKYFSVLLLAMSFSAGASAKIWRVNNNAGVVADFTAFNTAVAAAAAGDTIHLEPSAVSYTTASITLTKRVIVIGPGYFLDPASTTEPFNAGLQAATKDARLDFFRIGAGADGSKFMGVVIQGSIYSN